MSEPNSRVVSVSREVRAESDRIFELIADPSRQPEWDGNDNLAEAAPGQRVHARRRRLQHDADRGTRSREPRGRVRGGAAASHGSPPSPASHPSGISGAGRSSRSMTSARSSCTPTTGPSCTTRLAWPVHGRRPAIGSPRRSIGWPRSLSATGSEAMTALGNSARQRTNVEWVAQCDALGRDVELADRRGVLGASGFQDAEGAFHLPRRLARAGGGSRCRRCGTCRVH